MTEVRQPTPPEAQAFKVPVSKLEKATTPQTTLEGKPGFWELLTGSVEGSNPSEHLTKAGELYEQWGTGDTRLDNFVIGWQTGAEAAHVLTSTLETYWANLISSRDPSHQPFQAPAPEFYASRRQAREDRIAELRAKLAV